MREREIYIMQSEISGKVMRGAADVGVVRYMMVTSDRSSIALNSHDLFTTAKWIETMLSVIKPPNLL